MPTIYTNKRDKIKVDKEDLPLLNKFTWYVNSAGYASSGGREKFKQMHRLLMNNPLKFSVDHINGDKLDNRRINLRVCTHRENLSNQKINKKNTSGFKGVSWSKSNGKWEVYITYKQKHIFGGYFKIKELAAEKYNELASSYFGEFARLNLIKNGY